MRQVLQMNPLASAMRYGPCFFAYWRNVVSLAQGTKHSGSAAGPETTFGPSAKAVQVNRAVTDAAASSVIARRSVVDVDIRIPPYRSLFVDWNPAGANPAIFGICLSRQ